MKQDKIRFIYPPLCVHEFPHMALPQLKGFLNKKGYNDIRIYDFNVGIMKEIIWSRLYRVSQYYEKQGINVPLSMIERNFMRAKDYLSDGKDRGKDEWAIATLNVFHKIAGSDISQVCYSPKMFSEIVDRYNKCVSDDVTSMLETKIKEIVNEKPDVVGITIAMASQLYYAFYIGRELKKRIPNVNVLFGGSQITLFWKTISKFEDLSDSYDFFLSGEGEIGLYQYLRYREGKIKKDAVSGLVYRVNGDKTIKNPNEIIKHESELVIPNYDDYIITDYVYPKLPYMMNKGCYWSKCTFCSYRNEYPHIKKNIEHVVSDIKYLKEKYQIRYFHFIDDAIPPEMMKNFSAQIIKENVRFKYENYLRLDNAYDNNLCNQMAKSGLRSALFGLESANMRILKLMRKGINPNIALHVLKNMRNAGIKTVVSCMIGFPTETNAEALETISFLQSNREAITQAYIVRFGLISDMKDSAETYGIYDIDEKNLIRYDDAGFIALGYSYKTCEGMTADEITKVVKYGRRSTEEHIFRDCFFS